MLFNKLFSYNKVGKRFLELISAKVNKQIHPFPGRPHIEYWVWFVCVIIVIGDSYTVNYSKKH